MFDGLLELLLDSIEAKWSALEPAGYALLLEAK
jgi:hypothetical protein